MGDPNHVAVVKGGQAAIAAWRSANLLAQLNLESESFARQDLRRADLHGANLENADLKGAWLVDADLKGADLRNADLTGAWLMGADFTGADLRGARLDRADLSLANFSKAKVAGASAVGAVTTGAISLDGLSGSAASSADDSWPWGLSWVIGLLAVVAILGIGFLLWTQPVANTDYARGLITVVFAIGTTVLALILVAARWLASSIDAGERFQHTKEILTIFVGIFGTVVGWYFGQTTANTGGPVSVGAVALSQHDASPSAGLTLMVAISGGEAPYNYRVAFGDGKMLTPTTGDTPSRMLVLPIKIPAKAQGKEELPLHVTIKDRTQAMTEYTSPPGQGLRIRSND
jgi:hypothetical protein